MRFQICSLSRAAFFLFVTTSCFQGCSEKTVQAPAKPLEVEMVVIDGAQVWDGTGVPPVQDAVIVIKGDRIDSVGPRGVVTIPAGARTIDAKGKTVIPGLINSHGHVGMTKGLKQSKENYNQENIISQLKQYARYGVTTVMSLGTDFEAIYPIRKYAKENEAPRAAVLTAGRGFTGKNGYPAVLPGNAGLPVEVDNVEQVKAHIQELANLKVDMVKIWVDDHLGRFPKIRPELYQAIISEAHKAGLRVMAHLFYLDDARKLVAAGLDGMAHSIRDREVDDALIKDLKDKGTFAVPTLTREESTFIYAEPPAFLDDPFFTRWTDPEVIKTLKDPAWGEKVKADPDFSKYPGFLKMAQKNLKKLFDAGVKISFGTDTGPPARFQGFFEHRELELMVQAGLTPSQALQTATMNAAECLGISKDVGTLESGKRADLVVLNGDPFEDILNTRKIAYVFAGGREVH